MSKTEKYENLYKQLESLLEGETDQIANMANMAALIHETFGFWWTGFYRVMDNQLILGPFQGPLACSRIGFGKGVCGTAVAEDRTQLVYDVHQFPGHIACDCASNSEIVVPIHVRGEIWGVLDIDSPSIGRFTEEDKAGLQLFVHTLEKVLEK